MSRIGKMPIPVPAGVKVEIVGNRVSVRGPKGELSREFYPQLQIALEDGTLQVTRPNDAPTMRAMHGLTRALLNNMVVGVTTGFSKTLVISGTGYRAELQGTTLVLNLGYSHPVVIEPPKDVKFEVNPKAGVVTVWGVDKEVVGELSAKIRGWRPVEPYLGKGIRYSDEKPRRKAGKAGKAK